MEFRKIPMAVNVLEVTPVLKIVDLPIREPLDGSPARMARAWRDQSVTYQHGEVRHGHGRCSGAVVTVQIGTSADIEIDFTVNAISEETFSTWKSQARQFFNSDRWSFLDERWGGSASIGGFFGGCFGFLCGGGNAYHYRNSRDTFSSAASQEAEGFLRSVHNLDNSTLRMRGRLRAVGQSYIPVSCSSFIEVLVIQFADGKTLRAVSSANPIAANPDTGNTSGIGSEPTNLNVITL